MPHALAVDRDRAFLLSLTALLEGAGFSARTATTLAGARSEVAEHRPDVALVDLHLPDGCGTDLLPDLDRGHGTDLVLLAGRGDVDVALEALQHGAADVLTKPVDVARLHEILAEVARSRGTAHTGCPARPPCGPGEAQRPAHLLGDSPAIRAVWEQLARVAATDTTVLLTGESGTGKDVAARTLHRLSHRAGGPFLPIPCGGVSPTRVESELFGHERGSLPGAEHRLRGAFERARGGTLLLDEVTELPAELQVKLLRVLETGELLRIGGERPVPADARVVAATRDDPQRAVQEGRLREDLFYRLSVFPVALPALRDRGGDAVLLARQFLSECNAATGGRRRFTETALERLSRHPWPGNVRELKTAVQRACLLAEGEEIDGAILGGEPGGGAARSLCFTVGTSIEEVERSLILATLAAQGGNKRKAAEVLGVSLKTLYNRLNAYRTDDGHPEAGAGEA